MSLYNMIFGMNPQSDLVLALLGLRRHDVERFRDCSLNLEDNAITIYARTGGGNREGYPQAALTSHPDYLGDVDDDFDNTYATFSFRVPPELAPHVACLANPSEMGLPAPLIRRIAETMRRDNESDKRRRMYENHQNVCRELLMSSLAIQENGWCLFPLGTDAAERIFATYERDGEWLGDNVIFGRLRAETDVLRWKGMPNWFAARVTPVDGWPIDREFWERCRKMLGEKYPKAVAHFGAKVDEALAREASKR